MFLSYIPLIYHSSIILHHIFIFRKKWTLLQVMINIILTLVIFEDRQPILKVFSFIFNALKYIYIMGFFYLKIKEWKHTITNNQTDFHALSVIILQFLINYLPMNAIYWSCLHQFLSLFHSYFLFPLSINLTFPNMAVSNNEKRIRIFKP